MRRRISSENRAAPSGRGRRKPSVFRWAAKWVTKKQVRITIPARPFLGLSEDDMQEMKATVEEFIQKED